MRMRFFFLFPVVSFLFLNTSHSTENLKSALDAYHNAPSYGRGRLIANVISCSRSLVENDICTNSTHDKYEDLEKQVEELVGDKENLTIELSTVRLARTSLNTQLITSKGLLLDTERDLSRARDRIEVLVEDKDELTRKIEELNLERANLLQKLKERKASCVELEEQLAEAEKAQQELKDLQSSLTEERDQLLVKISLAADVETARLKELKEKEEDFNKVAEQLEISQAKSQELARGMTI